MMLRERPANARRDKRQLGQLMVEFFVVTTFGVIGIIALSDDLADLANAVRQNYQGYAFVVSLSEYPDQYTDDPLRDPLAEQGIDLDELERLSGVLNDASPIDDIDDLVDFQPSDIVDSATDGLTDILSVDFGDLVSELF